MKKKQQVSKQRKGSGFQATQGRIPEVGQDLDPQEEDKVDLGHQEEDTVGLDPSHPEEETVSQVQAQRTAERGKVKERDPHQPKPRHPSPAGKDQNQRR